MTDQATLPETPPAVEAAVDKSADRVRKMFGEIAPRYDLLNHLLSMGTDYYWRWRTVRKVSPQGAAPILDVCTGTGDLALAYWKRAGRRVPVVGADFARRCLSEGWRRRCAWAPRRRGHCLCHRRQAAVEPPGVTFVEADTEQLPFPSDRFQIVSVAFGLRNVNDAHRGLQEMTRVCQPGGRVAVLEFSLPTWAPLRAVYGWYFRNVLPRIGQALGSNRSGAYNYLPESVGQFPYGEALAELMRGAGLREVRYYPLTFGIATLYVGRK